MEVRIKNRLNRRYRFFIGFVLVAFALMGVLSGHTIGQNWQEQTKEVRTLTNKEYHERYSKIDRENRSLKVFKQQTGQVYQKVEHTNTGETIYRNNVWTTSLIPVLTFGIVLLAGFMTCFYDQQTQFNAFIFQSKMPRKAFLRYKLVRGSLIVPGAVVLSVALQYAYLALRLPNTYFHLPMSLLGMSLVYVFFKFWLLYLVGVLGGLLVNEAVKGCIAVGGFALSGMAIWQEFSQGVPSFDVLIDPRNLYSWVWLLIMILLGWGLIALTFFFFARLSLENDRYFFLFPTYNRVLLSVAVLWTVATIVSVGPFHQFSTWRNALLSGIAIGLIGYWVVYEKIPFVTHKKATS